MPAAGICVRHNCVCVRFHTVPTRYCLILWSSMHAKATRPPLRIAVIATAHHRMFPLPRYLELPPAVFQVV